MKLEITTEKWNLLSQPTVGESYYLLKKGKKIWFNIIEQGWTKTGVYLKLSKIK
jgi:expansin (peptidoglycan-binding protein)